MSQSASPAQAAAPPGPVAAFLDRHHFVLRRVHSLLGIVPIGGFVIFHLFTVSQMSLDRFHDEPRSMYQHEIEFIHQIPALLVFEVVGLWLPIALHAALGLVYTLSGSSNVRHYPYGGNWRYHLQRITGVITMAFIFFHVATLRWRWNLAGWFTPFFVEGMADDGSIVDLALASTALALQHNAWVAIFYGVGVLSAIFHWCNGLWTAAITWGLTFSVGAQRRWGYACIALFIVLTAMAVSAFNGALRYPPTETEKAAYDRMMALDPHMAIQRLENERKR